MYVYTQDKLFMNLKAIHERESHYNGFILITKKWKQPKCPSSREERNKQWTTTQNQKGIDTHSNTDNLNSTVLKSQAQRPCSMWFHFYDILANTNRETGTGQWLPEAWGRGGR